MIDDYIMPVSDSNQIPAVLKLVREVRPKSVLDVGAGWGLYGMLFRASLDGAEADISNRQAWKIKIDGIEIFPEYIGDIQRSIYSEILIGNVVDLLDRIGDYDVIYMGDLIEHLEKQEGLALLRALLGKARSRLIVSTPNGKYEQGEVYGNTFETHLSEWVPADFLNFPHYEIYSNSKTIIAVLSTTPIEGQGRRWAIASFRRYPFSASLMARLKYRCQRLWGSSR